MEWLLDWALPGVVFHMHADFNVYTNSVCRKRKAATAFEKIRLGPFRKPVAQAVAATRMELGNHYSSNADS